MMGMGKMLGLELANSDARSGSERNKVDRAGVQQLFIEESQRPRHQIDLGRMSAFSAIQGADGWRRRRPPPSRAPGASLRQIWCFSSARLPGSQGHDAGRIAGFTPSLRPAPSHRLPLTQRASPTACVHDEARSPSRTTCWDEVLSGNRNVVKDGPPVSGKAISSRPASNIELPTLTRCPG